MQTISIRGPLAQDKDAARALRTASILPAMVGNRELRLDFSGVTTATQSFVHALISEPLWRFGERAIQLIEFHRCAPQVQSAIETVVGYSLRAREFGAQALSGRTKVESVDVPQADDLNTVRRVVETAADGPIPASLALEGTGFSARHFSYRANAARVLGLVVVYAGVLMVSERGEELLRALPRTDAEALVFREAIANSRVLQRIARGLLSDAPPEFDDLVARIVRHSGLGTSTAERRAQCLLSWRRQLALSNQLTLPIPMPGVRRPAVRSGDGNR